MPLHLTDIFRREGDHIGRISLERPPRNLIDREIAALFRRLPEEIDQGLPEVRAVMLSGLPAGPFCAGSDPALLDEARDLPRAAFADLLASYRVALSLAAIQRPVVAAIEGEAHDQGLELALAADLRVAAEDATFRMAQVSQGLIPWDGGTQRLSRVVGRSAALEMLLTGRTLAGPEALEMGLVSRLVPPGKALEAAWQVAESIARGGPVAARYAKEAVHAGMDLTLEQGILLETDLTMILQTTSDRMEGIRSFLERRAPTYTGE